MWFILKQKKEFYKSAIVGFCASKKLTNLFHQLLHTCEELRNGC